MAFKQFVLPNTSAGNAVNIDAPIVIPAGAPGAPEAAEEIIISRRLRLQPSDFQMFGYTGGCAGCVNLQKGTPGSRNHTEACRLRMEKCLSDSIEGRARKERANLRR